MMCCFRAHRPTVYVVVCGRCENVATHGNLHSILASLLASSHCPDPSCGAGRLVTKTKSYLRRCFRVRHKRRLAIPPQDALFFSRTFRSAIRRLCRNINVNASSHFQHSHPETGVLTLMVRTARDRTHYLGMFPSNGESVLRT